MQYGPYLRAALGDAYRYDRKRGNGQAWEDLDNPIGANGGDSRMVLQYLRELASDSADFRPDVLLVNCGLHDIKTKPGTDQRQVMEEEYRSNLKAIITLSRDRDWPLVFLRTTPVIDSIHNTGNNWAHRFAADVSTYNGIADSLMQLYRVPVIDLHSFSAAFPNASFQDHVHYTEAYRARQGAFIAGHLLAWRERYGGR
jgi:lysophospholipase L1-like esterase